MNHAAPDLFAEVKAHVGIAEAFSFYGVPVNSRNTALCPFHNERTASLRVYPDTNSFYCYGCGIGGSAVDFVGKLYGLEPLEAARKLDADFNLGISGKPLTPERQRELAKAEQERQRAHDVAAAFEKWREDYLTYLCAAIDALSEIISTGMADARDYTLYHARMCEYEILEYGEPEEKTSLYLAVTREVKL